jgi:hypothetical protein
LLNIYSFFNVQKFVHFLAGVHSIDVDGFLYFPWEISFFFIKNDCFLPSYFVLFVMT